MSLTDSEPPAPRPRVPLDALAVAMLCLFVAAGAVAFSVSLSPHGYRHGSGVTLALLLGAGVSLLLWLGCARLLARRTESRRAAYAAALLALILLGVTAGTRSLLATTGSATPAPNVAAQRAFEDWQAQAIPLLVAYKDSLAADAASGKTRVSLAGVERARRRLAALEPAVRRLAAHTPPDLRRFMPLLVRAVTLGAAAQSRYEAAQAAHGRSSRVLLRQATRLLRHSQEAMTNFSLGVNGVGARLTSG